MGVPAQPSAKRKSTTDFVQTRRAQAADPATQAGLGNGYGIVQIDGATASHAILDIEDHFRWDSAHGGGD
jgi:hypothetical protein